MLATDERWVRRALIRLYQRQTASEQASEQTHNHNLQGFQPCDARWFSRLAQYATRFPDRPLSAKQLAIARRPWRGEPAICKYARQLMAIAAADAEAKQPTAPARKFSDCERCGEELLLYQERDLFNLLRYMKYLVDTMRKNNIVWGVGRGSSVASYVLYLIGIHRIDSIKYNLDINEFLKEKNNAL